MARNGPGQLLLAIGILVGVDQPNGHHLRGDDPQPLQQGIEIAVEAEPQLPIDKGPGPVDRAVVERGPVLSGDLDYVLVSGIGYQSDPCPGLLEEGIGRHRGPV